MARDKRQPHGRRPKERGKAKLALGILPDLRGTDDLRDAVNEQWDNILYAYQQFADKKPIVLFDIQEQRIYVYPYEDFKNEMSSTSQQLLTEQYEKAVRKSQFVVFVRDNEQRRLVSFSMNMD